MLKAGFYEKEITPPLGYAIPGYYEKRFGDGVHDRLYAKALSMDVDGKTVITVVMDGLYTYDEIIDPAFERIEKIINVPRENVMISATHSHTGMPSPSMEDNELDNGYAPYFHILSCFIADAAILAYQRMVPAKVRYASSIEKGLTFNRNYYMKDGTARTNPGIGNPEIDRVFGKVDEEFITMYFLNEEDKPMGAILNFACHTDSTLCKWGWNLSADYPGVLSGLLKEHFGSDFVPLFMLGACGNLNVLDINRGSNVFERPACEDVGEALAKAAICHYEEGKELEVDVIDSLKENVLVPKKYIPKEEIEEAYYLIKTYSKDDFGVDISKPDSVEFKRHNAEKIVAIDQMPDEVPVCVQTLRIGECLIFALLGEQFTEYGLALKEKSPAKYNIVASIANGGKTGYIPTKEAFGTQIYEAQLPAGWFGAETGEIIVEKALSQAERIMK